MIWRYRRGTLSLDKTAVMGILNITPDSFSDGGRYLNPDAAVSRAEEMLQEGADILDLGAQSTRPGHRPISPAEELERLLPVLRRIRRMTQAPLSVDTYYPQVAQAALEAGADILNDVSGSLQNDMPRLAARAGAGLVMMQAGEGADDRAADDAPARVRAYFETALETARLAGLPLEQVCLDPGIGFGNSMTGDFRLIAQLPQILEGLPPVAVLVGASRKRVTSDDGAVPVPQRLPATLAIHTLAQAGGARILRVHDVREAVLAARAADRVLEAGKREG